MANEPVKQNDNKTAVQPANNAAANEYIGGVLAKINQFQENGDLKLPANYAPENALRSAYLILLSTVDANKSPVLDVCTKESIANSLLEMVLKGLNPAKKQCYFIAYGKKLELSVSYMGNLTIAKRVAPVEEVAGAIIYEGDVFEYAIDLRTGRKSVTKHEQSFENINNDKIKGAYATVIFADGTTDVEIMNMPQIRLSWGQGSTKGTSPAHKNFPDQMALKTVKNRAVKVIIGSSDDESLFNEEEPDHDFTTERVNHQIEQKANKTVMNFSTALPEPNGENVPAPNNEAAAEPVKVENNQNNASAGIQPSSLFNGDKPNVEVPKAF